jgi:hypothetical protein
MSFEAFAKILAGITKPSVWRILLLGSALFLTAVVYAPEGLRPRSVENFSDLRVKDYLLAALDLVVAMAIAWMVLGLVAWALVKAREWRAAVWAASEATASHNTAIEKERAIFATLDGEERAALACFVKEGRQTLGASWFNAMGREHDLNYINALFRLVARDFVYLARDVYGFGPGDCFTIKSDHFRALSAKPELVQLSIPPKTFG